MGGLFHTLNVAGNSMAAQQTGAHVAGNNINNVNTPGYHRQQTILHEISPGLLGVKVFDIQRVRDQFIAEREQVESGSAAFSDRRAHAFARLEETLGGLGEYGLSAAIDRMFGSFRQVATAPQDRALRMQLLSDGDAVASRLRSQAEALVGQQQQIDSELRLRVDDANALIDEVAKLNGSIKQQEASGANVNALRDRRDAAIKELGELLGARAFTDGKGDSTVLLGGVSLVQASTPRHIQIDVDVQSGFAHLFTQEGTRIDLDARISSGAMGALLDARDNIVAGELAQLDQFAFDVATAINAVHAGGFGLDGSTGNDFFAVGAVAAGSAAKMALAAGVDANPDAIAAASDPLALPGDGRVAQAMADLELATIARGGTRTAQEALADVIAGVGQGAKGAYADQQVAQDRLAQVENLREQVSGVSLEEQMIELTKYQRAFEAAQRIVTTVDDMIQTVLGMKR